MVFVDFIVKMHTLDFNVGETNNFLRSELTLTRSLSTASIKVGENEPQAETTVDSILKNISHAGVKNIIVVKRMYIDFKIQVSLITLARV